MTATTAQSVGQVEWFTWENHRKDVWNIEQRAFPGNGMNYEELGACIRDRHNAARVLLIHGEVMGYVIERFHPDSVEILTMAVEPAFHRFGSGTVLMNNCKTRARHNPVKRRFIETTVSEENVSAQLFLQSCGFRYVQTVRGGFTSYGRTADGYQFSWKVR